MAVGFAMATAYILSRTLIPACAAASLPESNEEEEVQRDKGIIGRAFSKWQQLIEAGIGQYMKALDLVLAHRWITVIASYAVLFIVLAVLALPLRREFFPIIDGGAFVNYVRAASGTRLEVTNDRIAEVEDFIKQTIPEEDLHLVVSQIGITPDWSAAFTKNTGKMDATMRIQLSEEREGTAQDYVRQLRQAFAQERRFADLEFAFNSGGLIRGALNEGKVTPIVTSQ